MKPQRMAMTHQLVLGYGLHKHLDVYVSVLIWLGLFKCVFTWMGALYGCVCMDGGLLQHAANARCRCRPLW